MPNEERIAALERRIARLEQSEEEEVKFFQQFQKEREEWLNSLPPELTSAASDGVSNPLNCTMIRSRDAVIIMAFQVQNFQQFVAKLGALFESDGQDRVK